jgi:hypothetical protein
MTHVVPSFFIFCTHKFLRQHGSLINFTLSKIHVTLLGEFAWCKIPCFWAVYGSWGLLMGFLRGKLTFLGQLKGLQSLVEVEVESPVVHFYIVFHALLHCIVNFYIVGITQK